MRQNTGLNFWKELRFKMIYFIVGCCIGSVAGIFTLALLQTAAESDRRMEEAMKNGRKEEQ